MVTTWTSMKRGLIPVWAIVKDSRVLVTTWTSMKRGLIPDDLLDCTPSEVVTTWTSMKRGLIPHIRLILLRDLVCHNLDLDEKRLDT